MTRRSAALTLMAVLLFRPAPAGADVVQDWNSIMLATVAGQNPFAQARLAAITQLAVFEAVNAVEGQYEAYLNTSAAPEASAHAAASAAAHRVLITYVPSAAAMLDEARATSLAAIPAGQPKDDGIIVGEAVADALIALRASDGAGSPIPYTPLTGPGFWQPTPPAFGAGILLHWGQVTPFGLLSGDQFRSAPPPALTSHAYRKDYEEVQAVGDVNSAGRPADRADVAQFYAVTGAVHVWNAVAVQAGAAERATLSENARALALLNMAINDGLIASLETKYFYQFWRPVTAIRAGDTDGNPGTDRDPGYLPFIATPPFPSYPSAHASASYAARVVLEHVFSGGGQRVTVLNPAVPGVVLEYRNLQEITRDIDDARVFGGIHFRFDQEAGAHQGRQVGTYLLKHVLRPRGDRARQSEGAN